MYCAVKMSHSTSWSNYKPSFSLIVCKLQEELAGNEKSLRTDERMDGRTNGRMDERTEERTPDPLT